MSNPFPTMINVQAGKYVVTLIGKWDAARGRSLEIVCAMMFPPEPPQPQGDPRAVREMRYRLRS